jgi:galactoside O-acetyltransferase
MLFDEILEMPICDTYLMGSAVKERLKWCGDNVRIHPLAKICKPENVSLFSNCTIGDFVFIWGGKRTDVGKYSHIQVGVKIWGGGEMIIGNFVSVGVGSVLLSAVYDHRSGIPMVDHLPESEANTIYGRLEIGDNAYIGANCTIMPVKIGEGAVVGAGSVVTKNLEPWGIYVGNPAKLIVANRTRVKHEYKKY